MTHVIRQHLDRCQRGERKRAKINRRQRQRRKEQFQRNSDDHDNEHDRHDNNHTWQIEGSDNDTYDDEEAIRNAVALENVHGEDWIGMTTTITTTIDIHRTHDDHTNNHHKNATQTRLRHAHTRNNCTVQHPHPPRCTPRYSTRHARTRFCVNYNDDVGCCGLSVDCVVIQQLLAHKLPDSPHWGHIAAVA